MQKLQTSKPPNPKWRTWKKNMACTLYAALLICATAGNAHADVNVEKTTSATVNAATAQPGEVAFPLKYKGWNGTPKESYGSYYGFGTDKIAKTDFAKSLKLSAPQVLYATLRNMQSSQAVLECDKNGKPLALYIDLNSNGKLDDGEKLSPQPHKYWGNDASMFLTPDFQFSFQKKTTSAVTGTSTETKTFPYRLLAIAQTGADKTPNLMWSPSCVMESKGSLNGKNYSIVLYDKSVGNGNFTEFGDSSISFITQNPADPNTPIETRSSLSKILRLDNQFYELRLANDKQQIFIKPSTLPTGSLEIKIAGAENTYLSHSSFSLIGDKEKDVNFSIPYQEKGKTELPALAYKMISGNISYQDKPIKADAVQTQDMRKNLWSCDFSDASVFNVSAGQTATVELGKLELSISTMLENNRYQTKPTTQTVFKSGDTVYINRTVKGKGGEQYGRFRKGDDWNGVPPTYQILDAKNKSVASGNMEYG